MSAETCGGIHLIAEDFSLAVVVVAFNGSQSWRPPLWSDCSRAEVGNATVFQF